MKWKVLIISFCLIVLKVSAQVPVTFTSNAMNLFVMPDERLIITTRGGEIIMADSSNGYWHSNSILNEENMVIGNIDRGNFFNRDTGFVSGYIDNNGRHNIIYRTTDGGKNWQKIDFGRDGWVDDAYSLDNGEAWMSVAGRGMAYTSDYGLTWQPLVIYDTQQRFSHIFFNTKREGLIGSVWNTIAYTRDNCQHWKSIPTPLDQHKYKKTDKGSRPSIGGVAIYKDYFLVNQEGMIFYSKRDSINWTWLPEYIGFSTDAANSALFLLKENQTFVRTNDQLEEVFTYPQEFTGFDMFCRNGNLFFIDKHNIYQLTSDNKIRKTPMLMDGNIGSQEPKNFDYNKKYGWFGVVGSKIYRAKSEGRKWKYLLKLPVTVDDPNMLSYGFKNTIVYQKNTDSVYYRNIRKRKGYVISIAEMLQQFEKSEITSITFNDGSMGCDHYYYDQIVYNLSEGSYVLADCNVVGSKHTSTLKADVKKIDKAVVEEFVKQICNQYNKQTVIKDLAFTEADYKQCKEDILNSQSAQPYDYSRLDKRVFTFNRNNLDFEKLLATVDSIKNIDAASLNSVMRELSVLSSTTTNWATVNITNSKGETIVIQNAYDTPNAMYFPWKIRIKGASIVSVSPEITRFVKQVCPSLVAEADKVPILHELVKKLYLKPSEDPHK